MHDNINGTILVYNGLSMKKTILSKILEVK